MAVEIHKGCLLVEAEEIEVQSLDTMEGLNERFARLSCKEQEDHILTEPMPNLELSIQHTIYHDIELFLLGMGNPYE
jgi:hypothetical protein